jgi:hypothetical protein
MVQKQSNGHLQNRLLAALPPKVPEHMPPKAPLTKSH